MEPVSSAANPGPILQLKVRLLGISPMVWRRILVPESASLRELLVLAICCSTSLRRRGAGVRRCAGVAGASSSERI